MKKATNSRKTSSKSKKSRKKSFKIPTVKLVYPKPITVPAADEHTEDTLNSKIPASNSTDNKNTNSKPSQTKPEMDNLIKPCPSGPLVTFSFKYNILFLTTKHSIRLIPVFGDLYKHYTRPSNGQEGLTGWSKDDIGQEVFFFNTEKVGEGLNVRGVVLEGMKLVVEYELENFQVEYLEIGFWFDESTLKFKFTHAPNTPISALKKKLNFCDHLFQEVKQNTFMQHPQIKMFTDSTTVSESEDGKFHLSRNFQVFNSRTRKTLREGQFKWKKLRAKTLEEARSQCPKIDTSVDKFDFGNLQALANSSTDSELAQKSEMGCIMERNRESKGWIYSPNVLINDHPDSKILFQFQRQKASILFKQGKELVIVYGIMNLIYCLDPEEKLKIITVCPLKGVDFLSLNTIQEFYQLSTGDDTCLGLFVTERSYFVYDFDLREVVCFKMFGS
jgi:hypothetical protein